VSPSLRRLARQALFDAFYGPMTLGLIVWVVFAVLVLCSRLGVQ
jgi:hypothetical protein